MKKNIYGGQNTANPHKQISHAGMLYSASSLSEEQSRFIQVTICSMRMVNMARLFIASRFYILNLPGLPRASITCLCPKRFAASRQAACNICQDGRRYFLGETLRFIMHRRRSESRQKYFVWCQLQLSASGAPQQ